MATLTGTQVRHTYDSLLKLEDNDGLDSSLKKVTDGLGTESPLSLSETEVVSSVNVEASGFQTPTGTSDQILLANGTTTSLTGLPFVDGSGTTNYLAKWSDSDTVTDSVIYDDGTKVGIGTNNPDKKLEVYTTPGTESSIRIRQEGQNYWDLKSPASNTDFTISDVGGEKMRIKSGGNVGIGTNNPDKKLEVQGAVRIQDGGGNANKIFIGNIASRSDERLGITTDGSNNAAIRLYDNDRTFTLSGDNLDAGGKIELLGRGNGDAILFYTNGGEQMRMAESGNVGIGETNPISKLEVKGTGGATSGLTISNSNELVRHYFSSNAENSTYGINYDGTGGFDVQIRSNGDIGLASTTGGNIAIGSEIFTEKLSVAGNIAILSFDSYIAFNPSLLEGDPKIKMQQDGDFSFLNSYGNTTLHIEDGGDVGIGTTTPDAKLDVNGGIRMADDTSTALPTNAGTLRYRTDTNNSYVDMCMQTGTSTYAWVNILTNTW